MIIFCRVDNRVRVKHEGFYGFDQPDYTVQRGYEALYLPIQIERCPRGPDISLFSLNDSRILEHWLGRTIQTWNPLIATRRRSTHRELRIAGIRTTTGALSLALWTDSNREQCFDESTFTSRSDSPLRDQRP